MCIDLTNSTPSISDTVVLKTQLVQMVKTNSCDSLTPRTQMANNENLASRPELVGKRLG